MTIPAALGDLPVVDVLAAVGRALAADGTAVLVAPPGAGKTTVTPLWLLDQPWLGDRRVVLLEPRRLATRAAAQRMASVLGEPIGATVGYQTRDERHIGPGTRVEVVTEGVLTRRLQHDPSLDGVGAVVFDEIHERNLPTDVGLAFTLDARDQLRPDLRVLAMSATPDAQRLSDVLGGAPVVASDGRQHPVELRWLPMKRGERVEPAVASAVLTALRDEAGDVLVFLPGIGEIRRVESLLRDALGARHGPVAVHALAGALSAAEQDLALAPSPPGTRRVVLSTDIAESSLTVPGIRVVVDAGQARVPRHDVRTGMTRLTTVATSRASADQRAGRAGRVEPGVAYRLWSKLEHATRRAHLEAEITQVDLAGLALELAVWGTPAGALRFIDAPPPRALQHGVELLGRLGALDAHGRPTDLGRRIVELPLHPRLATMVHRAAAYECSLACVIAATLDERDVFRGRPDELPADLALRVSAVCGQAHDRADPRDVRRARERAADLARRAGARLDLGNVRPERCGALLALAYPDRVAVRRSQPGQFQLRGGSSAWTPPHDPLAGERFVVAADLDGKRQNARIRIGAALDADEVADALGDEVGLTETLVWDKQRDDLVLRTERRLGGMLLDEHVRAALPGEATTAALLDRVRATRLGVLRWTAGATGLRDRVAFLRALDVARADPGPGSPRPHASDNHPDTDWPDLSDRALLATLDEWLAPYLAGATGADDLKRLDIELLLSARLGWDRGQLLAEMAPLAFTAPSGHAVRIDYSRATPTASVRVQDMFGASAHPTVGASKVPVTLELLSPADRPVQVTNDLPTFWRGSWNDVKKEMAGRYPKHQWPDDPAVAAPKRLKDRPQER